MFAFWKEIFQTASVKIYVCLLSLIGLIITARYLGTNGRGTVVAIQTWVEMFYTFSYLSLGETAYHYLLKNKEKTNETFSSLLVFAVANSIIFFIIFINLYVFNKNIFGELQFNLLCIGFFSLPFIIWEQYSNSLFLVLNKLNVYNKSQAICKTIGLAILLFFIITLEQGVIGFLISVLLGYILYSAYSFYLLFIKNKITLKFSIQNLKNLITKAFSLHFNAIGSFFFIKSDILMLNYYLTKKDVGIYDLGFRLIWITMLIPISIQLVSFSRIAKLGVKNAWGEYKTLFFQAILIMILIAILEYILSPYFIPLVASNEFIETVPIFKKMLLLILPMSIIIIFSPQIISRGWFKLTSVITIILGLLNLLLNYLFIPRFGLNGAIFATIIVNYISMVVVIYLFVYINSNKYKKKEILAD